MLRKLWDNLKNGTEATGSGKGTKEIRMFKYFIFAIMIFLSTFTGCGGDGGGGNGNNKSSPPKPIRKVGVRSFGQISVGSGHACALSSGGGVKCWGNGTNGQLGNNANITLMLPGNLVVDSGSNPLTGIVQVYSGSNHSCALDSDGGVWCWGQGTYGRLGNDASTRKNHAVAVVDGDGSKDPLTSIVQIGGSNSSPCALTVEGTVKCWGFGSDGRLGNKSNTHKDHPVDVVASGTDSTPLSGIIQISQSSTSNHACGVTSEGGVVCWGYGGNGQLGNGNTANKDYPVAVVTSETDTTPLGGIVQVNTGWEHTCALTDQGGVKCWGEGSYGRLGNKSSTSTDYPVDVVDEDSRPLIGVVQIASGTAHTCALLVGGGVVCWGYGPYGQMGNGGTATTTDTAVRVLEKEDSPFALSGVVQIDAGEHHVCALASSGEVLCWGVGTSGRLGNNATDSHSTPVKVVADSSNTPFNVGVWRGQYRCWEDDGTCEINPDSLLRPVLTGAREGASATPEVVVLGVEEDEVVALHTDAGCSGESIGDGTVAEGEDEVTITPDTDLVAKENRIYAKAGSLCSASGADYTLTGGTDRIAGEDVSADATPTLTVNLLSNGDKVSVHKSPDCSDTALASGTATGASLDVTLSDLGSYGSHTLYLKQGSVCHPRGLGYKLANYIGEPSRVAGGEDYTCAVTNAGGVKCWGQGGSGRLGNNATASTDAPDDVDTDGSNTLLTGIVQVATGSSHTCALTSGGNVKCWGDGGAGRLGNDCDASCTGQNLPVDVVTSETDSTPLAGIVQISGGTAHTCALTAEGNVKCWGYGFDGSLGNNDSTANKDAPVDVVTSNTDSNPLTGIVRIDTVRGINCALTSSGGVKCWGSGGYGQLGNDCNGSCANTSYPVDVVASDGSSNLLSGIVQISVGRYHSCALTSGGNVKCWGKGGEGQLGNGATGDVDAPVTVTTTGTTALTGIAGISMGVDHSCALKSAGGVVCWGEGDNGRLGDNTSGTDRTNPVDVLTSADGNPALAGIAQIGSGNDHSCAVTTAGAVKCWGHGDVGQLGNNATSDSSLPVDVVDTDGGSGKLSLGTTKRRYICGDVRCALETE